jgi:hypothetical protein
MSKLQSVRCFWCKRMLWRAGEPPQKLDEHCGCIGYGRHRFHARVRLARLRERIRRCMAA